MPHHITCTCGRLIVVPESQAGQLVQCPRCDSQLQVPPKDAPSPPPAPSPPADERLPMVRAETGRSPASSQHRHRQAAYVLAASVVVVALFSGLPIVVGAAGPEPGTPAAPLERWAYGILLAGLLQLAYTVYLVQVPDWSSVRVVSLVTLAITALYATLMGIRLLAPRGNRIMELLELDGNRFSSGQEAGWCLVMLLLTGTISYFGGRLATRWYRQATATADSGPA